VTVAISLFGLRRHDTRKINDFQDRLCRAFLVVRENQRLEIQVLITASVPDIDQTTNMILRKRLRELSKQKVCQR